MNDKNEGLSVIIKSTSSNNLKSELSKDKLFNSRAVISSIDSISRVKQGNFNKYDSFSGENFVKQSANSQLMVNLLENIKQFYLSNTNSQDEMEINTKTKPLDHSNNFLINQIKNNVIEISISDRDVIINTINKDSNNSQITEIYMSKGYQELIKYFIAVYELFDFDLSQ